jgi:amidase
VIIRALRMGWSMLVGVALGLAGVRARRLRPLDFGPFEAALATVPPERDARIGALLEGATLSRVQELMDADAFSAGELTLHVLARARRLEGRLCSVMELNPVALEEARAADERRSSGRARGPLDGIPLTIKDNIEMAAPMHTTGGSVALADHVAERDADVVAALRRAGAVIVGKANLSELAGAMVRMPGVSAVGGETRNAYGERFTPGGSSSGSAVAVAAGLCLGSLGTETSGSLLAPAAFNSIVGMKPSRGLVSQAGIIPLVTYQDSAGPLARTVADAAALLQAIATNGMPVELSAEALRGVPAAILREDVLAQRSPFEDTADNAAILTRIEAGLRSAGASVSDTPLIAEGGLAAFEGAFMRMILGGLSHDTLAYLAAAGVPVQDIGDLHAFNLRAPRRRMPRGQFLLGLAQLFDDDAAGYQRAALEYRERASRILDATFEASGAELLVSLGSCHSPIYATAGYPAITVPAGLRQNGMPVGATFIGRASRDATLLGYAHAFEQATHLRVDPPDAPPS